MSGDGIYIDVDSPNRSLLFPVPYWRFQNLSFVYVHSNEAAKPVVVLDLQDAGSNVELLCST